MTAPGQWANEETALAEHIFHAVCDRASGRSEPECLRNYPRDVYFIGNLRPRDDEPERQSQDPPHYAELRSKVAPVATGAEFLIRLAESDVTIEVTISFACYYRLMPTLAQQRGHQSSYVAEQQPASTVPSNASPVGQGRSGEESDDQEEVEITSPEADQTPSDRRHRRTPRDSLFVRFKKVTCRTTGRVHVHVDKGNVAIDANDLQAAVDTELTRAQAVATGDPERVRTSGSSSDRVEVTNEAIRSERDYHAFVQSQVTEVRPAWRMQTLAEARAGEGSTADLVVRIELVNTSPRQASADGRDNPNVEPYLFDVLARFAIQGAVLLPFDLDLAPRGFRYDRSLWGRGFNCAAELASRGPPVLATTHTPVFRQGRHSTRLQPVAGFADLAADPAPTLANIAEAMKEYLGVWDAAGREYSASSAWREEHEKEFQSDRRFFEKEIERFANGSRIILSDPDVLTAFRLTNETFRIAGEHPIAERRKASWRLFQIVFLVSQVPGIWALAHPDSSEAAEREKVDIIYFPTGGGKTEAYLATIVFHCFYDRLRGKTCGTAVWTRFPLRLLTLQQTQRVADVLGIAELVRRGHSDRRLSGPSAAEFAVGYFVGKEGTPNELVNPAQYRYANEENRVNWSQATDAKARQAWKRITRCPACKTISVQLDFDLSTVRLAHRCTNARCQFPGGQIPCYIVDNEIFRYLPAVVVGTIDKLAGVGNQRKLAQLFGQVDGRCSIHGFYKGKCNQKDCTDRARLKPGVPAGICGPTLFVQDELHLLKEGLGTFDAHYESFVQSLRREFGQIDTLKIIASSATIEAFERQVLHLYARRAADAVVFPGVGPLLRESFYAQITVAQPQRLYVGILPHNKTLFNAILELIESYHLETQRLSALAVPANPYGGHCQPGSPDWNRLLDNYMTSVTYFLAGRDLNSIRTDITGDVNPSLARAGHQPLEIHELTGDTNSDEVTRVLGVLETPVPNARTPRSVLATSMISHGVDIDRLNAMIFYGMPRQTSEYIQASSRVGRSLVGVVFCCLHPVRERDRSHYTYFAKYHEFLGQLVEPVAINRWATFSAQRTLPGLFMGVLLQVIANRAGGREVDRFYRTDYVKQKIADGSLRQDSFFPMLESAYLVQGGDPASLAQFRSEIRQRVPQFFDQILTAGADMGFVSDVLIPSPMRSLRDVDEPVVIELDTTGSQWAGR